MIPTTLPPVPERETRPPPLNLRALRPLVREHLQWEAWAQCIEQKGITIERSRTTAHPDYPSVVYPLDYGFVPGTLGTDGDPLERSVVEGLNVDGESGDGSNDGGDGDETGISLEDGEAADD